MKSFATLCKSQALTAMEEREPRTTAITDEAVTRAEAALGDDELGLVAVSRQLHYLLANLTTDSARLAVTGNVGANGFQT